MQNPNGPSLAASVSCPVSVAVSKASAAIRFLAVPSSWRQYLRDPRSRTVHAPILEVTKQRFRSQGGTRDRLGQDDRDFLAAHCVGLMRRASLAGQQRREPVLLGLVQPVVVGLSGHAKDPAGLATLLILAAESMTRTRRSYTMSSWVTG